MQNGANDETVFLYISAYKKEDSADYDYDTFLAMHNDGWVTNYDIGIVEKDFNKQLAAALSGM